ncbi:hypothetical protein LTR70_005758 [Exophiala xenobiotica]|uniref:Rhodopsin domain-containing protein n=1 Tax=Lithohypha guttulata TaxID=1690604 RepID=A0ABR0KAF2_9EURO|nr:hypothetical protein LTR24_005495 [Lithohypha guttulata]KAK5317652.1 hypothetical protein LTR70_005758 [Exophiala xenobiotica]
MAQTHSLQSRLATAPPKLQTKLDMNPTLIVSWFCTIFSLIVILIRVLGRWVRTERLFREDRIMLWSIIPLMIRMAFAHIVLIYGTNNTETFALSDEDIHNRSTGSRVVLASRIFYAIYIWVAKATVLEFVQKIIGQSWTRFYNRGVKVIRTFLALTLVAVIIATLAECQPFSHYWQVVPDPGPACRVGKAQLITMGTCDIITDLVLMVFPIPLVIISNMPLMKKISLVSLFLLSLILIAITAYRIPSTINRGYSQQFRCLLASLEILAATCVANIIVIGSFLRDKGVKKVKYRVGSMDDDDDGEGSALSRPATRSTKPSITQRHWGSDEDLVRGLGLTISHDLRHDTAAGRTARVAPAAEPARTPYRDVPTPEPTITPQGRGLLDPVWSFRKSSKTGRRKRRDSDASSDSSAPSEFKLHDLEPYSDEAVSPNAPPETPYKKMSFFDNDYPWISQPDDILPPEHQRTSLDQAKPSSLTSEASSSHRRVQAEVAMSQPLSTRTSLDGGNHFFRQDRRFEDSPDPCRSLIQLLISSRNINTDHLRNQYLETRMDLIH